VPCADTLENCRPEGCASGDPELSILKNKENKPSAANTGEMTIRDVIALNRRTPTTWRGKPARTIVADLGEGQGVRIKGFLINAHQARGTEVCNCHLPGPENNDYHLNFIHDRAKPPPPGSTIKQVEAAKKPFMKKSMVIEMSPRSRDPRWSLPRLQALSDTFTYVRVTGWLMFDSEHASFKSLPRATAWEIHPVTKFEVCTRTVAECDGGTGWKNLETLR
jgi:hypothetical protein